MNRPIFAYFCIQIERNSYCSFIISKAWLLQFHCWCHYLKDLLATRFLFVIQKYWKKTKPKYLNVVALNPWYYLLLGMHYRSVLYTRPTPHQKLNLDRQCRLIGTWSIKWAGFDLKGARGKLYNTVNHIRYGGVYVSG